MVVQYVNKHGFETKVICSDIEISSAKHSKAFKSQLIQTVVNYLNARKDDSASLCSVHYRLKKNHSTY